MPAPLSVLVVEDDAVDRKFLVRALRRADVAIESLPVPDLASAREQLAIRRFDCVLTDLRLPDGQGTELISETSAAVVVITGGDDRDAKAAIEAGAQDWLDKGQATAKAVARAVTHSCLRAQHAAIELRVKRAERFAAVGHVAAALSHELNNAGAVVLGVLELLHERLADAPGFDDDASLVESALEAAERTARITRGLMAYGQLEVADDGETYTVEDIVDSLRHLLGRPGARGVQLELEVGEVPPLKGHGGELLDMLVVLTMTLAERLPPGRPRPVRLRAWWEGGLRVQLAVDGEAFPADVRGQPLDAFLHVQASKSDTAFGLWLAESVSRGLGGTVRFSPELQPGLHLWLPLEPAASS